MRTGNGSDSGRRVDQHRDDRSVSSPTTWPTSPGRTAFGLVQRLFRASCLRSPGTLSPDRGRRVQHDRVPQHQAIKEMSESRELLLLCGGGAGVLVQIPADISRGDALEFQPAMLRTSRETVRQPACRPSWCARFAACRRRTPPRRTTPLGPHWRSAWDRRERHPGERRRRRLDYCRRERPCNSLASQASARYDRRWISSRMRRFIHHPHVARQTTLSLTRHCKQEPGDVPFSDLEWGRI